jgi:hypothetical protein
MKKMAIVLIAIILITLPQVFAENHISPASTDLPPRFSWRDIDGVDYTTPVKDQSPAPTCETYALCAVLETIMQYQEGELFEPDLSETHLYFYAGGTYEAGGVNLLDAADYLIEYGVPDEGCYPDPHRPYDYSFESLPGWEDRTVKIAEWGCIEKDYEAIKQGLIDHGPLVICISVYSNFLSYKGGIYDTIEGEREGGHLVALMGYDDTHQYWIVKNSWGDKWGEDGYIRISYNTDIFISPCYGGTGFLYVDGLYGNFKPDVPKVYIERPDIYYMYMLGLRIPTIFRDIPSMQKTAPRIFGRNVVKISAENTNKVEFYLDGKLRTVDEKPPYRAVLRTLPGLHTITVLAYNEAGKMSMDIRDEIIII